ncbi:C40 family peptidase [Halorussus gelatinilyticus]|uniref:C40 family peptidase n=1 Tax=Halorussus gelatinilyticus TaxID=2937524 RepID=A0A8U0INF1_9EURY|nr:C40 family peptidase [Halorussus gelatinilyticus]UPW02096.1 C40 family peptidase [Halorussus gelatinilyticus]
MTATVRLRRALEKCETERAPDPRLTVFDVTPERTDDAILLSGTVLTDHLKARAVEAVEAVADAPVAATDVTVLDAEARRRTITAPVAPIRGAPADDAEQVTQVLYGAAVEAFDADGDWRRVRTPDGYVAWVERAALAESVGIDADAVVSAGVVRDLAGGEVAGSSETAPADESDVPETLYAGTECRILDEDADGERSAGSRSDGGRSASESESAAADSDGRVRVRFRTGAERTLPADTVARTPAEPTREGVVAAARSYLGTEYVWGGMTVEGIDCSGLTWTAYHRNGVSLPRDADLQRRIGEEVAREEVAGDELAPGDLLFFPGHVALSLGGAEFVHAYGDANEVVVDSLDPDAENYNAQLDEDFELATRPL